MPVPVPAALRLAGSFMWHGRDLRQYRRLLTPPLQRLLTCPGTAALGRGLASIPLGLVQQSGLQSTLSTLAEDAVTAASESPFVEGAISRATAVLCVLCLPPRLLEHSLGSASAGDTERYAVRSAVQVRATTLAALLRAPAHSAALLLPAAAALAHTRRLPRICSAALVLSAAVALTLGGQSRCCCACPEPRPRAARLCRWRR
jgi:hypothetical protein